VSDRKADGFPVVVKAYDLMLWVLGRTAGFPRRLRGTLTARVEMAAIGLAEALGHAAVVRDRAGLLDEANGTVMRLRLLLRACKDLGTLSSRQYEYAMRELEEIGRMCGGWRRAGVQSKASTRSREGEGTPVEPPV